MIAGLKDPRNMTLENDQSARRTSWHLTVGLVTLGVAVVYVVCAFLAPWPPACLLTLLALLYGSVVVLCGLALKANRERRQLSMHVGVFLAILVSLYLLTVGPCNFFGL